MKKFLPLIILLFISQFLSAQRLPFALNMKNLQKAEMLSAPINNGNPDATVLAKDFDNSIYSLPYGASATEKYAMNPAFSVIPVSDVQQADDWIFLSGAYMKNVGNLSLTGAKVTTVISHYPLSGGSATKVYEKTSVETTTIEPDSISGLIIEPAFDFSNGKGLGRYAFTTTVSQDSVDQTKGDNSFTNNVYVAKGLLSKSKINTTTKALAITQYWGGGTDYRELLMPFSLKHGKDLFIDTLHTAFASNEGVANMEVEGRIYKWVDANNDQQVDNDEMHIVAIGSYKVPANAAGNFVNVRIPLENLEGSTPHYQMDADNQLYFASLLYAGGSNSIFNAYEMVSSSRMLIDVKDAAGELQYEEYPYLSVRAQDAGTGGPDMTAASLFYVDLNGDASAQDEEIFFFPASMALEFSGVVATKDLTKENNIQMTVNPNPARENANVHVKLNVASKIKFELFSSAGKLIESEEMTERNTEFNKVFQVQTLSEGTYIVKATSEGSSVKKAFVVIK
ncbi:MAG: T9SS type A sorting domain-containing protein [Saprospiraceae bacterium]